MGKSFDIKNATIKQKTNYFDSNTFSPTKGLIIAGDHSVYGSIEGAVLSGFNASKENIELIVHIKNGSFEL